MFTASRSSAPAGSGSEGRNTNVLTGSSAVPASSAPGTGTPSAVNENAPGADSGSRPADSVTVTEGRESGTTSPGVTLAETTASSAGRPKSTDQPWVPRSLRLTKRPPAVISTSFAAPPWAPVTWYSTRGSSRSVRSTTATPALPAAT